MTGRFRELRKRWRALFWLTIGLGAATTLLLTAIPLWRHDDKPASALSEPLAEGKTPAPIEAPIRKPPPQSEGFVGSAACAGCHPKISSAYREHPMAQSLLPVSTAPRIEDYKRDTGFSPSASRRYRVERKGEDVFHHEIGLDQDGEIVFDQAVPVHYAIGSGQRGRSYLINRGGWLYMSPISWYSQGRRWDLSPEYPPDNHLRFERPAVERCLQCHAGRLAFPDRKADTFIRHGREPFVEHGIGCERCHGPGREHIARHRMEPQVEDDPIVNPTKLDPMRREAVCNQCHLRGEYEILRYGRTFEDFRPGDHVGENWSVFVHAKNSDGRGSLAVSQVEQMFASKCFRASRGSFGCISCHDPHSRPAEAQKHEFYQDRCLQCHQQDSCGLPIAEQHEPPALGSCVVCHMPRFGTSDIPHTTQTDHRILARPEAPRSRAESDEAYAALTIFDDRSVPLSKMEQLRAQGLVLAIRAEASNEQAQAEAAEDLLKPIAEAVPDDIQVLDNLAIAYVLQGKNAEAVNTWLSILQQDRNHREALRSLAITFQQFGHYQKALGFFERYVAVDPWKAEMHGRLSHVAFEEGQPDLALDAAYRSLELDPSVAATHAWIAELLRRRGETKQARAFSETHHRLERK